jgi:4-oxalomesaconate hydratase
MVERTALVVSSLAADVFLDITPVWEKTRAAIECMEGQEHLWEYYTRVAQNRANHFQRNSGGQSGGRAAKDAEGLESVFPRTVDSLL